MNELKDGEELQVGDIVISESPFGKSNYEVVRLTKTMAIVKLRGSCLNPTRMPRIYSTFSWRVKGGGAWSQTQYRAFRL